MDSEKSKDERLSEPIGFSAFWPSGRGFECHDDACYIADTPESLGAFMESLNDSSEEEYETVEVSVSDVLNDFCYSHMWYDFEPGAMDKFKAETDGLGFQCSMTPRDSSNESRSGIFKVRVEGPVWDSDDESLQDIVEDLAIADGEYKRKSVDETIENKAEIIPLFIEILEDILETPEKYADAKDFMFLTYAVMLLGHFKEPKAHKPIIKLLELHENTVDALFGDLVHENIPTILFRTSGGSFDEIKSLVLNQSAWVIVRAAALKGMVLGVLEGDLDRNETLEFFSSLFLEKKDGFQPDFWRSFAWCVYELHPQELMDIVKELFSANLVNPAMKLPDFDTALEEDKETFLEQRRIEKQRHSLDDIHKAMSWWTCFNDCETDTPRIRQIPVDSFQEPKRKRKSNRKKKSKKKMKKASKKKNRR